MRVDIKLTNSDAYIEKSLCTLVDVRDNLHKPINYYKVSEHDKSYFFIKSDNEIYLYTLKSADVDRENKNVF